MNKLKELTKKRGFIIALIVLTIALVGGLGTYAMFYWRSAQNTEITLKIGDIADVTFPEGQELNTNNLTPVFNYTDGETLTFSIQNKDTTGARIKYTVNFNITNIDEQLRNESLKYKLLQGNNVKGEGNFSGSSSGDILPLLENDILTTGTSNFTLYIYIDSNIENNIDMMNRNISGVVEVTAREVVGVKLVNKITDLYNNDTKEEVTNNGVTYNYATNVGLMKDRLGGTSATIDSGNIRYYGANPDNYIDIGDKTEVEEIRGNWKSFAERVDGVKDFDTEAECLDYWEELLNNTGRSWEDDYAEFYGYATLNEFCSTTTIPAGVPILWRIIGVFDGKLRIRRDENIGEKIVYDASNSNVNNGYGINQWGPSGDYQGADLMKLLNPGYNNNLHLESNKRVNNSLYWNSNSGYCYLIDFMIYGGLGIARCDFTNTGLSNDAKEYVVDQTLYLGGFDRGDVFANEAWVVERGTNVFDNTKSCFGQSECNDDVIRTLSWTGKVGLIYPSDYGYAADLSNDNCKGDLSTFDNCTENWMANGQSCTISPSSEFASPVMAITSNGNLNCSGMVWDSGTWPVLTLSSEARIGSGTGTKLDPYVLAS